MNFSKKRLAMFAGAAALMIIIFIILVINSNKVSNKLRDRMEAASSQPSSSALSTDSAAPSSAESDNNLEENSALVSDEVSSAGSSSAASTPASSAAPASSAPAVSSDFANISDDSGEWNLRLVNGKYALPESFSPDLSVISMDYARDQGMRFDSRAIGALEEMCAAAKADGLRLIVSSAYRSFEMQDSLYKNKVNYFLGQGYGDEEAMDLAATVVARPRTSEHNLGLAVDFGSIDNTFAQTPEFAWLQVNCVKYGFIMRYEESTQDITGVIYEPWHYRYVGKSAALQISQKGITLEEYLGKN